jgi:prophage regulatory protein
MSNLIRFPVVQVKTGGLSRSTIWRLEREGRFPKRRVVTANTVAWNEAEIDAWIQSKNVGVGAAPGTRKADVAVGARKTDKNGGRQK